MPRPLPFAAVLLSRGLLMLALGLVPFAGCSNGDPGGTRGTGGASSGGAPGSGGASASGGAPASGGASGATGGAPGSGGASASGGAPASGGAGVTTGGAPGSGGASANTGGASPTGGAGGRAGGGAGGTASTGGAPGVDGGTDGPARPARVLLYSFSTLDIPSVPAQLTYLKQKLEGWGFTVDQSKDPTVFTDASLAKYAAVGMINTCFFPFGANNMGAAESQALQKFLQAGGGLFGTHCANVTFQSVNPPPLYNQLIGGRSNSENFDGTSQCTKVGDHPTNTGLPATFPYKGNLDNAAFVKSDSMVLVKCTWGTGKETAVSWVRNEGAGRVFFTNFAKVDSDLKDATLGDKHIIPGLAWVLGR